MTTLQKPLVSIFDDVAPRFASSWTFLDGIIENFRSRENFLKLFLILLKNFEIRNFEGASRINKSLLLTEIFRKTLATSTK